MRETADMERPRPVSIRRALEAAAEAKRTGATCELARSHGRGHVVTIDGVMLVLCASCAQNARLDRQIARARAERTAMRAR